MIKGILFTAFFILLAISIALIIIASIKLYRAYDDRDSTVGPKAFLFGSIGAFVLALGLVITIPGSFHQVDTGTVAVVRNLGKIEGMRQPGTYFDFYMTKSYETYDTKVQQDKITTMAYSKKLWAKFNVSPIFN